MTASILFDNRLNDATPTASTTAAGFNVLNLRDWRPFTFWKPTALPATVTVDCGQARTVDMVAVVGHNINTSNCYVDVRGSNVADFSSVPHQVASNRVISPDNLSAFPWVIRGNPGITANAGYAPDGTLTATRVASLGVAGVDDVYQSIALGGGYMVDYALWIKRVSTSGTIRLNPASGFDGAWNIDLSKLSDEWEFITRTHPAVTIITEVVGNSNPGPVFSSFYGAPLDFYIWRVCMNQYLGGSRTVHMSNGFVEDVPLIYQWPGTVTPCRYWRMTLTGLTGATIPQVAMLVLGKKLDLPTDPETADPTGRKVHQTTMKADAGHVIGRVTAFEGYDGMIDLKYASWDWIRRVLEPAWRGHLRDKPFFYSWNGSPYVGETRLVVAGDKLETPHHPGGYADVSIDIEGVVP